MHGWWGVGDVVGRMASRVVVVVVVVGGGGGGGGGVIIVGTSISLPAVDLTGNLALALHYERVINGGDICDGEKHCTGNGVDRNVEESLEVTSDSKSGLIMGFVRGNW